MKISLDKEKSLKMEDIILKDLERAYSKVVEKFPSIKKEELKLKYSDNLEYVIFLMVDEEKFLKEQKLVIDPSITVGSKFLSFTEEEKESAITHELGHYSRYKRSSPKKIEKSMFYTSLLNVYASNPAMWTVEEMDKEIRHKMGRVKKWHYMQEVYADNKAVEAGYGKVLINVLTRHLDKYGMMLVPVHRDELTIRIKNLEEKLSMEAA